MYYHVRLIWLVVVIANYGATVVDDNDAMIDFANIDSNNQNDNKEEAK